MPMSFVKSSAPTITGVPFTSPEPTTTYALSSFTPSGERLERADVPKPFRGHAIAFVTAGIMSLAFLGFTGFARL